jgi:hypothetical protein
MGEAEEIDRDINGAEVRLGDILAWRGNGEKGFDKLSEVVIDDDGFLNVRGITWGAYWWLNEVSESYERICNKDDDDELRALVNERMGLEYSADNVYREKVSRLQSAIIEMVETKFGKSSS